MRLVSVLSSAAAALILSVGIVSAPANATVQISDGIHVDDALELCVATAVEQKIQQWTCTAEGLYVQRDASGKVKRDSDGKSSLEFHEMKSLGYREPTEKVSPSKAESLLAPVSAAALADEYDTWCENGTICDRLINDYIAETKGNAAYGNQNGAIGAYDVILRTNLNGRQANNTVTIYHDAGPSLGFTNNTIYCFEVPIGVFAQPCGETPPVSFTVSQSNRKYSSGLKYGNYLANANPYLTQVRTSFLPAGYNMYEAAPLTNKTFNCPKSGNCRY